MFTPNNQIVIFITFAIKMITLLIIVHSSILVSSVMIREILKDIIDATPICPYQS